MTTITKILENLTNWGILNYRIPKEYIQEIQKYYGKDYEVIKISNSEISKLLKVNEACSVPFFENYEYILFYEDSWDDKKLEIMVFNYDEKEVIINKILATCTYGLMMILQNF